MTGNYREFYEHITKRLRSTQQGPQVLRLADKILRLAMEIFYPVFLAAVFLQSRQMLGRTQRGLAFALAAQRVLPYILIPGIGFILLSVVRKKENWKRPYEEWDIEPLIHREGTGCSMPSRHAFSAAVIAMCALQESIPLGAVCLFLAAAIAVCRVLGGVHYPKDAAVGVLAGVMAGGILPYGLSVVSIRLLAVMGILLAISLRDWKEYRIPNHLVLALILVYAVTYPLIEMGLAGIYSGAESTVSAAALGIIGGADAAASIVLTDGPTGVFLAGKAGMAAWAAFALLWRILEAALLFGMVSLISGILTKVTGRKALGGGDRKLIFAAGLYLGISGGILCLFLSCILVLILCCAGKRRKIPMGPALSAGIMACLLWNGTF